MSLNLDGSYVQSKLIPTPANGTLTLTNQSKQELCVSIANTRLQLRSFTGTKPSAIGDLVESQSSDFFASFSNPSLLWIFVFALVLSRFCRLIVCTELTVVIMKLKRTLVKNQIGKK